MPDRSFRDTLKHSYNVFDSNDLFGRNNPISFNNYFSYGVGSTSRPDRARLSLNKERNIIASVYNKIATDVAAVKIQHVKTNKDGRYESVVDSGLNRCLNIEANLDQTGRELIFDTVISMFDEGVVALVPVETSVSKSSNAFDILQLRTGQITQWYPKHVKVKVYDENDGQKKEILLSKRDVCIIENPFYSIMNEHNSSAKRLIDKLNLLDEMDNRNYKPKLDLIVQLPYSVKSDARKKVANERIEDLEKQLENSTYGVGYIDSTEKVTQLNRSIENKLLEQVTQIKEDLYNQLGITQSVFDGTADEKTMLNYQNSTIEPVLSAITNEMIRKFLTKTARTQGQTIQFVSDPFRLVPVDNIAEIADKFTRNEIMSANEIRSIIGVSPVNDERADELRNKNLNISEEQMYDPVLAENVSEEDISEEDIFEEL